MGDVFSYLMVSCLDMFLAFQNGGGFWGNCARSEKDLWDSDHLVSG